MVFNIDIVRMNTILFIMDGDAAPKKERVEKRRRFQKLGRILLI